MQIIVSSKFLGLIPDSLGSLGEVSWTPVDRLSQILVELALHDSQQERTCYYHLDNPKSCSWSSLVPVIQRYFVHSSAHTNDDTPRARSLKVVSLADWINGLEEFEEAKEADMAKVPALKLLDFYKALDQGVGNSARLDTTETCKRSATMRSLKAVDEDWMRLWLDQWRF